MEETAIAATEEITETEQLRCQVIYEREQKCAAFAKIMESQFEKAKQDLAIASSEMSDQVNSLKKKYNVSDGIDMINVDSRQIIRNHFKRGN